MLKIRHMATGIRTSHRGTVRFLLAALAMFWLLSLAGIPRNSHLAATTDEVRWSRVNIPTEGEAGNWVLAGGSDVRHLTQAADGTLYADANPSGTSYRLFKSTDGGYRWSTSGRVQDTIVDIATAPDDASTLYYATASNIYQSTDAGASFTLWPLRPGGAGSGNITITAIAVARSGARNVIAVGTRDNDSSQYGGVYLLDENNPLSGWINSNIGNYDVLTTAFSPNFDLDRQLVAVVSNETDTRITSRIDDGDWGRVIGDAIIAGLVPRAATIAFPDDYDATAEDFSLWVAIDSGSDAGDVYLVRGSWAPGNSAATDLNIGAAYNLSNVDVTALAVSGNTETARLMAGAANSTRVYLSADGGLNWSRNRKAPTGQSLTSLLMAPDFITSGLACAATSGRQSAFSITTDGGVTWNQLSLIDTALSNIVDLAPSPDYARDNTLFLLTFDSGHSEHSLWRSQNGGTQWARVLSSTLAGADSLNLVMVPRHYGNNHQTVLLARTGSNSAIWKSTDNGQTFTHREAPIPTDAWAVVNDDQLVAGSYDGTSGLVYHTSNGGYSYSQGAIAGSQPLHSIALSPGYEQDRTILVGNSDGWVYWSSDNGTSFRPLPPDAASAPLSGSVAIAFDPDFGSNRTVYAASSTADKGIYRFTINQSTGWTRIDGTLPTGGTISQTMVAADGTLYAANSRADGGLERSLNPTYSLGPTFETVTRGLDDGATLQGLWLQGNQLWTVDSHNTRLMTFVDTLTRPVSLSSPAEAAAGIGTGNVVLDWETLKGATQYQWQASYENNFTSVPSGLEGNTEGSSARLPALETATTYYWRVRATQPVLSPWSAKWSFTTSLGATVTTPELYSPKAGARDIPIRPVFQWSSLAGADSYELLVAADAACANPVITKTGDYALPATAWQSNVNLDYYTTYYWKVRATGSRSYSAWSAVGAFTTELATAQPLPPVSTALPPVPPAPLSPAPLTVESPPQRPSEPPQPLQSPPPTQLAQPAFSPPAQPSRLSEEAPPLSPSLSPVSPLSPTATPAPATSTIPDWFIYLSGALLLTAVLLLITILLLVAGMRRS